MRRLPRSWRDLGLAGELREKTLEQLGQIFTGKTPPSAREDFFGGNIPFVTPTDFDGRRTIDLTGRGLTQEPWTRKSRLESIHYVDLGNTEWGRIDAVATDSNGEAPGSAQRILHPGDTTMGTVRPGNGSCALVSSEGLTGSTGFAVLRPKAEHDTEVSATPLPIANDRMVQSFSAILQVQ
jgi:hypothetical protein